MRSLVWWLTLSFLWAACSNEGTRRGEEADAGVDASAPQGPTGRIQGRVELTDGTGLGGVGVAAHGVTSKTDELGIFVLDVPVGPEVMLTVESDYYTRAQHVIEVIENSSVSAALQVLPLKRLTLDDAAKDSVVKGDDGFTLAVPAGSLATKTKQQVTGKAEVRYAVMNAPSKMRAAPDLTVSEASGKKKLEAFGVAEVRFYKGDERLSYVGAETKLRLPLPKDHGLKPGDRVSSYHYDEAEKQFRRKGDAVVEANDVVVTADGFSTWCAARLIERTACVTGRIVDAAQRPTPAASVGLVAQRRLAMSRVTTGEDGRFCLESIAAEPHVLNVLSALDVFRGGEHELMTGAEAASCGSDACVDVGDLQLDELLFEAGTPAEGATPDVSDMDGGQEIVQDATTQGQDAQSEPQNDAGAEDASVDASTAEDASTTDASAPDAQIATPVVCDTPIWLDDPSTCSPDLVANGGATTVTLDGQSCAAFWLCAEEFNRLTLQIAHDGCMRTFIYGPNGTGPVRNGGTRCSGTLLDDVALNAQGPHLVVLESSAAEGFSGDHEITLWSVGNDPAATATLDGEPVQIAITDPGQNGSFSFTAQAGDRIALTIANSVISDYSLRSPTGIVSSLGAGSGTSFSDQFVVNETGTYTVRVDPRNNGISDVSFQVFRVPTDPEIATSVDHAAPVSFQALTPGQNGSFTFEGTAGQRIAFTVSGDSLADTRLTRFTGTQSVGSWAGTSVFSNVVTLPETGPYRLEINPRAQGTGTYTLSLWSVPDDLTESAEIDGAPASLSLTTPGQDGAITFEGAAGQRIAFRMTAAVLTDFTLWPPVGTQHLGNWATGGQMFSDALVLPQSGSYRLSVNPRAQGIDSNLSVVFFSVPGDAVVPLTLDGNGSQLTITGAGQNGEFTFSADSVPATISITISTSSGTIDCQLRNPAGTILATPTTSGTTNLSDIVLQQAGTYRLLVNPRGEALPVISASVVPGD